MTDDRSVGADFTWACEKCVKWTKVSFRGVAKKYMNPNTQEGFSEILSCI